MRNRILALALVLVVMLTVSACGSETIVGIEAAKHNTISAETAHNKAPNEDVRDLDISRGVEKRAKSTHNINLG